MGAKDVVVVLVGNKSDLEDDRAVSVEEGAQVAKKYGMLFTEASAKTGAHVQTAFTDLMAGVYRASLRQKRPSGAAPVAAAKPSNQAVSLDDGKKDESKKDSGCDC